MIFTIHNIRLKLRFIVIWQPDNVHCIVDLRRRFLFLSYSKRQHHSMKRAWIVLWILWCNSERYFKSNCTKSSREAQTFYIIRCAIIQNFSSVLMLFRPYHSVPTVKVVHWARKHPYIAPIHLAATSNSIFPSTCIEMEASCDHQENDPMLVSRPDTSTIWWIYGILTTSKNPCFPMTLVRL